MFRNFVIGLVLLAMIGIPVSLGVQSALRGDTSFEAQLAKSVESTQQRLPIEIDKYQSLTAMTFEPPFLTYIYTVDTTHAQLIEMKDYFKRQRQTDLCGGYSVLSFQLEDYRVKNIFKTPESAEYAYSILANPHDCEIKRQGSSGFSRLGNPVQSLSLEIEYENFFMPIDLENGMIVTELFLGGAKVKVDIHGAELVGMPEVLGRRLMAEFCSSDGSKVTHSNIEVMPSNHDDAVFTYILNTAICESGEPEFQYGGRGRGIYMSGR